MAEYEQQIAEEGTAKWFMAFVGELLPTIKSIRGDSEVTVGYKEQEFILIVLIERKVKRCFFLGVEFTVPHVLPDTRHENSIDPTPYIIFK